MSIKYYINLTAGLLQNEYQGTLIRIQSSHIESKSYDRLFYGLSDDLLYNLAIGNDCVIVDCTSNKSGKIERVAIPVITYFLNYFWFDVRKHLKVGSNRYLNLTNVVYKMFTPQTKAKLRYFKKFLATTEVKLSGITIKVEKEYDAASISRNE